MRIRPFTKRLTPWLTAYLLLVSIGLPLQRVYCACVDAEWVTVLPEERHECQHAEDLQAEVHHHNDKGCCHEETTADVTSCTSGDCGDAEVLYAQLDADFTVETATFQLRVVAVLPPMTTGLWAVHSKPLAGTPIRGPSPPPPLAGRQLLVAHQSFLI